MLSLSNLSQYCGSEEFYKHHSFAYSQGVRYLAQNGGKAEGAGAYWLLDVIWSIQHKPEIKKEEFIVFSLEKLGGGAMFRATDGNDKILYIQHISYSDFDFANAIEEGENKFKMFFANGVLYLPTEH